MQITDTKHRHSFADQCSFKMKISGMSSKRRDKDKDKDVCVVKLLVC